MILDSQNPGMVRAFNEAVETAQDETGLVPVISETVDGERFTVEVALGSSKRYRAVWRPIATEDGAPALQCGLVTSEQEDALVAGRPVRPDFTGATTLGPAEALHWLMHYGV